MRSRVEELDSAAALLELAAAEEDEACAAELDELEAAADEELFTPEKRQRVMIEEKRAHNGQRRTLRRASSSWSSL